jgi:hypothetical protein
MVGTRLGGVAFSPNGRHVMSILYNTKKRTRLIRTGDGFQHLMLSKYLFPEFVLENDGDHQLREKFEPVQSHKAWLDLIGDYFSLLICRCFSALVDGIEQYGVETSADLVPLTKMQQKSPAKTCVNSCAKLSENGKVPRHV